ncbi:MAG: DUF1501 domain-containing protein [Acidimicrobiales bacterium]
MTTAPMSRRRFLAGTAATCTAGAMAPLIRPGLAFAADGITDHTLVVVTLDGGLDGLSALVPAGDAGYGRARKLTRITDGREIGVDQRFALHPALAPLAELWADGLVAAVPAVGTATRSRSHFAEMAVVAQGTGGGSGDGTGWLARHLLTRAGGAVTLQGASLGPLHALELAGHHGAFHVPHLTAAGIQGWHPTRQAAAEQSLANAYAAAAPELADPAAVAFDALSRLRSSGAAALPSRATYQADPWADQLRQVAQLIRADLGMEAAVVNFSGWDTHVGQGGSNGQLARLLDRLGRALDAFAADLGDQLNRLTVVVASEFGRRVAENGSGGTDHGSGGLALVLGGGLRGGVHGTWPGLDADALDEGDLAVTTDIRSVLAEVVRGRLGNPAVDQVFPGFTPVPVGFVA